MMTSTAAAAAGKYFTLYVFGLPKVGIVQHFTGATNDASDTAPVHPVIL